MPSVLKVENRYAPRSKTMKRGLAVLSSPPQEVQVCIRNVSLTGAAIELDFAFALEKKFKLILVDARTHVEVETVWQKGTKAGLRFLGHPEALHLRLQNQRYSET